MLIFTDYERIVNIFDSAITLALIIFAILSWYYVLYFFNAFKKPTRLERGKTLYKYAVLIPARNEDNVISNILSSLKKQDYPQDKFDVYVIVESKDDPTVNITKKFGYKIIIRKDLVNKRTKGFALQEAIKYLKTNNLNYDSVIIFDADNVMNHDYISLLNDCKNKGYQIALGYRSFTNAEKNWVSACSATLFSFMNQFTSKGRSKYLQKATLTGTGYYIDMQVIDDAGGWIWTGMTEDVELTAYCYYHNVKMKYYPLAVYYDEQPTSKKVLHTQHIRWVYGFVAKKDHLKKGGVIYNKNEKFKRSIGIVEYNMSIWPFTIFVITEVLACIAMFILLIFATVEYYQGIIPYDTFEWVPYHFIYNLVLVYFSFVFIAGISLIIDYKNLRFKPKTMSIILFTYAFFFFDFVTAFIDGFIHKRKRTVWTKIEHSGEIINDKAKEINNEK